MGLTNAQVENEPWLAVLEANIIWSLIEERDTLKARRQANNQAAQSIS